MSNPIRLGLVGIGRAGWGMHCEEIKDKSDKFVFVAGCDILPQRRERFGERFNCRTHDRIEDLVADPGVEIVDIATRSNDHYRHAVLAMEAGKSVFLEKPMCLDHEEALRLKGIADVNGVGLFIRHNRRFDPDFLALMEIMRSGILGDVFRIRLCRHGFQRRDDWQTLKRYGGGQLLNWGPHIIDHALRLLESPVSDIWSDLKLVAAVGDAEDNLEIILRGENGRVVEVGISGGVAIPSPTYEVTGTRGSLVGSCSEFRLRYLNPDTPLDMKTADPGTPGETFGGPDALDWVERTVPAVPQAPRNIWDELYDAYRNGSRFPIELDEAIGVMGIITQVKRGTVFE